MHRVNGLHHITAISGPAQENLDFYTGVLGLRLVKKSVNQDDPGTYHLFYADAEGHPGCDLTFFPWDHLAPPRTGHGLAVRTMLEIPPGSLDYWAARLARYGTTIGTEGSRFGDRALTLVDPHGLPLALAEPGRFVHRAFTPWDGSPVPADRQIRGLHGAEIWVRSAADTLRFLTGVLGFAELGHEEGVVRFGVETAPGIIDVRETPGAPRGIWGVGCVHHLAWRVDDEPHQLGLRDQIAAGGARPTGVIDRFWFRSVYFREPGGVLFELATDGPGFTADETRDRLGESLVLPPWLEPQRTHIEGVLPALVRPGAS